MSDSGKTSYILETKLQFLTVGLFEYLWHFAAIGGSIQAILVPGRRHKKLNLLIEFWNSVFIKFDFEAYQNQVASSLHSKKIDLLCFFLFQAFIYPPDTKSSGVSPLDPPPGLRHRSTAKHTVPPNLHRDCRMNLWWFFTKYNIQKLRSFKNGH